jgi:hypothetical protein
LYPDYKPVGFRHQYKSITIEQICSAVSDQGQVYAAQFAPIIRRCGDVTLNGYYSGVPIEPPPPEPPLNYELIAGFYQMVLPTDEQSLTAMVPEMYMGRSNEGIYMPHRLAGPEQPFATTRACGPVGVAQGGWGTYAADPSNFQMGAVLQVIDGRLTGSTATQIPWPFASLTKSGAVAYPGVRPSFDSGFDNTNVGVVIFRGLQGSGGGGFGASLQIKVIAGLEIAAFPDSPARVFAEPPADMDEKAMRAYYDLCIRLKDAYPADYNGLEAIWDAIKDVAGKVWGVVEPVVVDVAQTGARMLGQVATGFLGAKLGARAPMPPPAAARVVYRAPSVGAKSSMVVRGKPSQVKRPVRRANPRLLMATR